MLNWVDKVDGVDDVKADDINAVAHEVNEKQYKGNYAEIDKDNVFVGSNAFYGDFVVKGRDILNELDNKAGQIDVKNLQTDMEEVKKTAGRITTNEDNIADLQINKLNRSRETLSHNYVKTATIIEGQYYNANHELKYNAYVASLDFFDIPQNAVSVVISGASTSASTIINYKDIDGNFLTAQNKTAESMTFTIPDDATQITISLSKGKIATEIVQFSIVEPFWDEWADVLSVVNTIKNRFNGKKANFLGDSITQGAYLDVDVNNYINTNKPYHYWLANYMNLSAHRNYGVASTPISSTSDYGEDKNSQSFTNRYSSMNDDADLIVVFGGTNDYGHNTPLGTIADTTDISFYGALDLLINGLIDKYVGKTIVFMTPLHRNLNGTGGEGANSVGFTLKQYVEAIREKCEEYSIPIIDTYAMSGLNPKNTSIYNNFVNDGLHPNPDGHLLLANNIINSFMKL